MRIIECMHTQSECYNSGNVVTPVGIVVHSTGANNTTVKRYSQPSSNDPKRAELLALMGTNAYNNHWNKTGVKKGVHYFVGKLADGSIASVHIMPETTAAWGVGNGSKGSYNYAPTAHIQFEICEDNLTNADYFRAAMKEAQELCADICLRYNWDANVIVSHREAHAKGYASNHGDCDNWLGKFGKNMNWFRTEVQAMLDEARKPVEPVKPVTPYTPKVGEIVEYVGTVHYRSANATTAYKCKPGLATVSRTYNGKHPYHLINTNNDSAYVYGWVDAEFIKKYDAPVVEEKPKEEVKEEVKNEPVVEVVPEVKEEPVVEPEVKEPEVTTPTEEPREEPTPEVVEPTPEVTEPETPVEPEVVEPKEEPKKEDPQPVTPTVDPVEPKKNFVKQLIEFIIKFVKQIFAKK